MSEHVNIDTMSPDELRNQAEALNISYSDKTRDRDLKAKIKTALGLDEEESDSVASVSQESGEKLYKVTVHAKDDDDTGILPVSVNGVTFPFPRGEEVIVKERYVHALRNCIKTKLNKKTKEYVEVLAHPFSAVPA